jgi:fused signal recognition particle receptor
MTDLLTRWKKGLSRSSKATFGKLASLLGATEINSQTWEDLESLLIQADLGLETSESIIESLQNVVNSQGLRRGDELQLSLREELRARIDPSFEPELL